MLEEFGNVIARGGAAVVIGSPSGHRLGALTPEQNKALATVPGDDLLKLPMLQCDRVTDTLYAYQLAKRGNALRVMAEAERWAKRGARVNTISPGIITPLAADELTGPRGEAYRSMLVQSPAGRAGTPRRGRDTRGAAHGLGRRVHHLERLPRELGKRLEAVERDRWRKPHRETFAEFADRFEADYLPGRNLKPATVTDYRLTLRRHLVPFLGHFELAAVDAADVDAYIAAKAGSLSPKTITNHVGLLRVMLKVARRWRLVTTNPAEDVDLPRIETAEMNVLSEAEIARLLGAYREAEADAAEAELAWWRLSRRLVEVALAPRSGAVSCSRSAGVTLRCSRDG